MKATLNHRTIGQDTITWVCMGKALVIGWFGNAGLQVIRRGSFAYHMNKLSDEMSAQ